MATRVSALIGYETTAALLFPLAVTAVVLSIGLSERAEMKAAEAEWAISGAPCDEVSGIPPAMVNGEPHIFDYGPIKFEHAWARAYCAEFAEQSLRRQEPYQICQFNNPGAITVTTPIQHVSFRPPAGRHATVTVREGKASCVVGGWFSR